MKSWWNKPNDYPSRFLIIGGSAARKTKYFPESSTLKNASIFPSVDTFFGDLFIESPDEVCTSLLIYLYICLSFSLENKFTLF